MWPTGPDGADDPEWAAAGWRRTGCGGPGWWRTAETTDLPGVLRTARGAVLIDGIGTWLAAVMDECGRRGKGARRPGQRWRRGPGSWVAAWRQTGRLRGSP